MVHPPELAEIDISTVDADADPGLRGDHIEGCAKPFLLPRPDRSWIARADRIAAAA